MRHRTGKRLAAAVSDRSRDRLRTCSLHKKLGVVPQAPDLTRQVLGGRYELLRLIGEGGFGRVYQARDTRLKRGVAVKVIKPWWAEDPVWRERFEDEIELLAQLADPGIVQIYDSGEDANALYYVSELVRGESLRERLATGPLNPVAATGIGAAICRGLAPAHDLGVIHRDIKPANILLTGPRGVKITDFGIARISSGNTHSTSSGTMVGTPLYWSPEQASGKTTTPSSDIYSIGVVIYETLAGHPPFAGDGHVELALKHLNEEPPALPHTTPAELSSVVMRALAKAPSARFRDARAMADALERSAGSDRPSTATKRLSGATGRTTAPLIVQDSDTSKSRSGKGLAALAAVLLLAAGGVAAWALTQHPADPAGRAAHVTQTTSPSASNVTVPHLVGESGRRAAARLTRHHLDVVSTTSYSAKAAGRVIAQSPAPGKRLRRGDVVALTVSRGPRPPEVPDVVGSLATDASAQISRVGLSPVVIRAPFPGHRPGSVVRQSPDAGEELPRGGSVTLKVAAAPTWHTVASASGTDNKSTPRFRLRGDQARLLYNVNMKHCDFGICDGLFLLMDDGSWDLTLDRAGTGTSGISSSPGTYTLDVESGDDVRSWSLTVQDYF